MLVFFFSVWECCEFAKSVLNAVLLYDIILHFILLIHL